MEKNKMMKYFQSLRKNYDDETFETDEDIPEKMIKNGQWIVLESTVREEQLEALEKEFNIQFPKEYKEFIGTCAHAFSCLEGKLDNFLFEDDVDVQLEIIPQYYGKELSLLYQDLKENSLVISLGYIPIGVFNDDGYLYIDTRKQNKIVWLPFEDCVGFTTYDEFDSEGFVIFENLYELMDCFFLGKTYTVKDQ